MTRARGAALLLSAALAAALWSSWGELSKLDVTKAPTRASWQLPAKVVAALGLAEGDRVADVGAGDGYFTFELAYRHVQRLDFLPVQLFEVFATAE